MALPSISFWDYVLLLGSVGLLYQLYVQVARKRPRLPHPPGPRGLPLIGTLPGKGPSWVTYRDWSQTYNSDILRVNMLGSNIIILNTLEASLDILEQRSSIYSDRPGSGMTMVKELCGLGWSFGLQPYGPEWRDGRKAFQREFHPNVVSKYWPTGIRKVRQLLRAILQSPDEVMSHLQHMVGGEILAIGYGIEVQAKDDPYVAMAEHAEGAVKAALNPGSYLVDLLPFLKYVPEWVPGAGFQREARLWRKSAIASRDMPYDFVKHRMAKDPASTPDCAAKSLIEDVVNDAKGPAYMERVVRSALGSMFLAGSDSSTAITWSFLLAMVLYPDIFKKAQASVDRVCKGRIPDFTDKNSLPYVDALVKESLRWNPVAALNLAHRSTKDDVYKDYFIPEGSIVVSNVWAILHDPAVYDSPEDFNPERFLKRAGPDSAELVLDSEVRDPMDVAFGFGRRICPGRWLAYDLLWLTMASVIAVFDVEKAKDEHGVPITPNGEYAHGFTNHPKPFVCKVTPRSPEYAALILATEEANLYV